MISLKIMLHTIKFSLIKGIGLISKRKLIEQEGSSEMAFLKLKSELLKTCSKKSLGILNQMNSTSLSQQALDIVEDCEKNHIQIIPYWHDYFPENLNYCVDAPLIIYIKGNKNPNDYQLISLVGTRNCSEYGLKECEKILEFLKPYRVGIVSGLAYGIDIFAHKLSNKFNIANYAVLGSGLNKVYPKNHINESYLIEKNGMIISEYLPSTSPLSYNFPKRNRIIAGMSKCTIVVESRIKGGAMITARLANEYNREVFAVPGNNQQVNSSGTNLLIQNLQANILNNPEQILELLNIDKKINSNINCQKQKLNIEEQIVYDIIFNNKELSTNEIQLKSGIKTSILNALLINLEIKQYINLKFGNFYEIKF